MFVINVKKNVKFIGEVMNAFQRLDNRVKFPIEHYEQIMEQRQVAFGTKNFKPAVNMDHLEDGAFYLSEVDNMWRRKYERKPVGMRKTVNLAQI